MEKLQWFKFSPTDWRMGKIQRLPEVTQIRFIQLLCLYWNKECILTLEDAEIEVDKEHIDLLLSKKVVKLSGDNVIIEFLNEQYAEICALKDDKSLNGKIGNLKRWHPAIYNDYITGKIKIEEAVSIAEQSHSDRGAIAEQSQNIADKIREEEIRKEKKRKEVVRFTPPTLDMVVSYFLEKGYTEQSAKKAHDYYSVADWKDSKGNQVKNWKQKMQGVWFKPENIKPSNIKAPTKINLRF